MIEETFENYQLSKEISRALDVLKYDKPTEVQRKVIPNVLENRDLVVKSETGSGKTAAFGIPICELIEWEENKPQALILTPTRELAVQVSEEITNIGRFKRIKSLPVYGREVFSTQRDQLKQKTHVVVGTPGRVMDHIDRGTLVLEQLKYLVIDEVDEMLNMGFIDQVETIIQQTPSERVTMFYSATLPEKIKKLSHEYMNNPENIWISNEKTTDNIEHVVMEVNRDEKTAILQDVAVVENPDSCIIFCNTKDQVNELFTELKASNYPCSMLHGGLEQKDRFEVMNGFKNGDFRFLIATDVAARGIDIDNVSLVVNYDVPKEKESYVHRTGRTGRAGNKGKAIMFVTPYEEKSLTFIENYIGFDIHKDQAPLKKEVREGKVRFEEKMAGYRTVKNNKTARINQDIMKLHFNGGKKKKIRAADLVGTLTNIPHIEAEDIGIITIKDSLSYVDILNGKGSIVLQAMEDMKVKGKKLKVSRAIK